MKDEQGLVFAGLLNGTGGMTSLTWDGIQKWCASHGCLWVHLDRLGADSQRWVREESGLDPIVAEALLEEETRPRIMVLDDSVFMTLRGVNLNAGADPEDMISIRLWIDANRVVTVRHRLLMTIQDIHASLLANSGPKGPGDFLTVLADRLMERMAPVIGHLDDEIDEIEEHIIEEVSHQLRSQLGSIRRQTIALRRYIAPQREVISHLSHTQLTWLTSVHRARIREVADHLIRYVEDLDAARDRMGVMQEELTGKLSEQMNKTMYILTVLAGIFLPITFVTGLLGINVGGIPGSDDPGAFVIVCSLLTSSAVFVVGLFRWLKWL
ncbi:MAG: zinc transporter ZntB [Nitrospirales bacterium]|nr:zinc transporter ZntB [Nitrospira sp.]MDR4502205.1 zinc transporter ZntB [Nitrospirales bacterium]